MGLAKRRIGPRGSRAWENKRFRKFNLEDDWDKGKQVMSGREMKPCIQCGCIHSSLCRYGTHECYGYGATDYKIVNYPKKAWNQQSNIQGSDMGANLVTQRGRPPTNAALGGNRGGKRPQAGGRVFYLEVEEVENPTATILGTVFINHLYAHVLFDSGANILL